MKAPSGISHSITVLIVGLSSFLFATSGHAHADKISQKRLACYYYDDRNPHAGSNLKHPGLPYVWARGLGNEHIVVDGGMVDGFFVANIMHGTTKDFRSIRKAFYYKSTYSNAQTFCKRALKRAFPHSYAHKILIHPAVKTSYLSSRQFAVVFNEHDHQLVSSFNRIIAFGDSLSDQSNLKNWLRIFPKEPYFAGRFSNREIWLDYFQRMTGVPVQNWAYAGSVATPEIRVDMRELRHRDRLMIRTQMRMSGSVKREIDRFEQRALKDGKLINGDSTLFTFWIGANDYLPLMETPGIADIFLDKIDDDTFGAAVVVDSVTDHIINHIKRLHSLGAQHFFVANLPDLGKTPRMLSNKAYHDGKNEPYDTRMFLLSTRVSNVIALHNDVLLKKLTALKEELPKLQIIFGDMAKVERHIFDAVHFADSSLAFNYDLKLDTITFTHEGQTVAINRPCYQGAKVHKRGKICAEPHRSSFWDDLHPSSYGHCLIASYFHHEIAHHEMILPTEHKEYLSLCRPDLL